MRVVRWATRCKQRAVHCLAMRTNTVLTPCKQGAVHFLPLSTTFYTSFIIRNSPVLLYSHRVPSVPKGMKLWVSRDETVSFKGWNCEFHGTREILVENKNKDKLQGVLLVCVSSANTGTQIIEVTFPRSHTLHDEERYIAFQWRATFAVLQPNYFPSIPFTSSSKSELIRWVLLKISYSLSAFSLACSAEIRPLSEAGCP